MANKATRKKPTPKAKPKRAARPKSTAKSRAKTRAKGSRKNPATSAEQYGAAQAVLSGRSSIMPKKVARELVDRTPAALRSKFARQLAALRRRRGNQPEPSQLHKAAALSAKFHGRPPRRITEYKHWEQSPTHLTELGRLVDMTVRTPAGERVTIGSPGGVQLACTPDGRQLYFLGRDQKLPIETDRHHEEIGKVLTIAYRTDKDGAKCMDFEHRMGEEGGEPPTLAYDAKDCRLYLIGGSYHVTARGIEH